MTLKSDEFPTLTELAVPIQYNYAGVPFVTWFDLKAAVRARRWEGLFVKEVEKVTQIANGFSAHEVETKLQEFKERID